MGERNGRIERHVAIASATAAILLGVLGLIGWALRLPVLTSIAPAYKAIAPSTVCVLILLGLILAGAASARLGRPARLAAAVVAGLIALYGLLEVPELLTGVDLNHEDAVTRYLSRAWSRPFQAMSPATGGLVSLVGASLAMLLVAATVTRPASAERLRELSGGLGMVAAAAALVFVLGYLYGTPLLYGTGAIPTAATGALGLLLLALGTVAAAGAGRWPLRVFAGPSVRARLMRAFVPLTVLAILISAAAYERAPVFMHLHHVIQVSLLAVVFTVAASLMVYRAAEAIGGTVERAQQALRESEERFRTLAESLPQLVWEADGKGNVTYLGRPWTEYIGEGAGVERGEYIHPEDRPRALATWQEAVQDEKAFEGEYRLRRRDGVYRWFLVRGVPTRGGEGRALCWVGSATDIDDRKRAEVVLQRYQFLSQEARDMILFVGLDGRILEANEAAVRAYGYAREELLSLRVHDLRIPELRGEVAAQLAKAERDGVTFETRHVRKDGRAFPVEISSRAAYIGGERVVVGIIRDISERKQVEEERERLLEEIERQRALLDTIVESTEVQLAYLDRDFNFLRVNAALARACDKSPEEFLGHNHFEFFPHEENEAIFRRVRDTGEAVAFRERPFDHPGLREQGTTYWDWTLTPVKDSEGRVEALVLSLVDVTGKVQARQRIEEAERQRAQLAETMSAEIDHRMKNNLALIASLLEMQIHAAEAGLPAAAVLRQAIARIQALAAVHGQLYASRSARVEVVSLLRRVSEAAVQVLSGIGIDLSVSGDAVSVVSKEGSTLAVIANELITNAVKYGGPDTDGVRRVRITVSRDDGKVRVFVWNSGNPVPDGFDPATRPGLGLQLAREAVVGQWRGRFSLHAANGGTVAEIVVSEEALTGGAEQQGAVPSPGRGP